MKGLAVLPLLLIEYRVLVLGKHFLLPRHLREPPFNRLGGLSVACQRGTDGVDYAIDGAEALALACFLRLGDPPGGFPIGGGVSSSAGKIEVGFRVVWGKGGGELG